MRQKNSSLIKGEYHKVAWNIKEPNTYQEMFATPIIEAEAEALIHSYSKDTDVLFYPDIRATATDAGGSNTFIRLPTNPLTKEDIENNINYPRLTLGVVLHELAHVMAGVIYGHNMRFVEALDKLIEENKGEKYKERISKYIEEQSKKKKIAKSIAQISERKCPTCNKAAETIATIEDINFFYHQLKCGHLIRVEKISKETSPADNFKSIKGEPLYPFQKENVEKFKEANGRLLIADEMGLGKTPSSLAIRQVYNLKKTLVLCKSGLKHQWKKMIEYWGNTYDDLGISELNVQIIENPKDSPLAGFDFYIISYDLLPNLTENFFKYQKMPNGQKIPLTIDYVIVDECQHIKNPEAQRTRAVVDIVKDVKNVVFLSGTPIKNNASEYYPVLNMIDPMRFRTKSRFVSEFVDTRMVGPYIKYGGIRDFKKFQLATSRFIIRHTQSEVLPDLPEITRNFIYTELSGDLANEYADVAKQFKEYYYNTAKEDREFYQNILQFFTKMRHLTGLAKVDEAVDYAIEFLESTERKLTIFTHHIDVREEIVSKLNKYLADKEMKPCLELIGNMDGDKKEILKSKFNFDPEYRILVASTLASGEGHNLQHACSDALFVERQWNPSNEEQAEFRFKRPGQKSSAIYATYLAALDTIDEYFIKLIEGKRIEVKYSLDGTPRQYNENAIMLELAQILAARIK